MTVPLRPASRFTPARIAEGALAIGSFAIGTGEFASMGFLPSVAAGLGISVPRAGGMISAYALGVVVGAPLMSVAGARLPRRDLLLILMGLFSLGNLGSSLAPGFGSLLTLRFLSGLPHGAYFGVASLVAASMAGPSGRARAVGRIMLGLTVATLVGTPLATWMGQWLGWRTAFAAVGTLGLVTAALVAALVPRGAPNRAAGPLRELGALKHLQVWLTLGIAAVGMGGLFAVFSYITPTLVSVSGVPLRFVPVVLMIFGAGMITGNIVGPRLADRALMPTIGGVMAWITLVMALFALCAPNAVAAVGLVYLIGTAFAVVPALQTRLMDVGRDAQTLAAALNHSAFNIANALGAWLGGIAVAAGYGWAATGWVGAGLGLGGLAVFGASVLVDRRPALPTSAAREPARQAG